ncbi:hypothetical protein OKW28_002421 [Paraburkholderia sp. 40]
MSYAIRRPRTPNSPPRDASQHLVAEYVRRVGVGFAGFRIAVLRAPHHLARLRVQRDELGVGLLQEDLAVAICETAIDGVAAHHRDDLFILLRLILPDERLILQVDRNNLVRKRGVDIHRVADHERRAFMAAQHAGRHGPCDLQFADVVLVDLLERAVAVIRIIARLGRPVGWVFHQSVELRIGLRSQRAKGCGCEDREPKNYSA